MNNQISKKQFTIYILAAFVIAYALQGIACVFSAKNIRVGFTLMATLTMFAPTIAVLIANKGLSGLGWKPIFKGKIRYILIAWFVPTIVTILGAVLFYAIFPNALDFTGMYMKESLVSQLGEAGETAFEQMVASGITPTVNAIIGLVQVLTYVPIINGAVALGEEIGWRGYMYPYLKERFGVTLGRILGGVIWGVWHWPLIIFAGYEYGTEYFGAPFAGPFAFLVVTTILGIFLDYVYEKTECILFPAIGHGVINGAASLPMLFFNTGFMSYMIIGPTQVGLISIIPLLIFDVIVSMMSMKEKK